MTLEEKPSSADDAGAPDERTSPRHRAAIIRRIRTLMEFWNITEDELQRARPRRVAQAPAEIKYRHPVSGDTWDGQGPQPDWLRQALLREGFTVEALRQAAQSTLEPQLDTPPLDAA
ncbi:MAG TPA: H-NS histone family protein [Burkholderiaceae bacterium]|nr:H-NS histone family protein [Burkholderiaceae bacterium]